MLERRIERVEAGPRGAEPPVLVAATAALLDPGEMEERLGDDVAVCDPRQVDAACRGEPVPLPEARIDLHQLEAAVAGIPLELDLGEAVEAERAQQPERRLDDLLDPDRLADAARADSGRR